MTDVPYPFMTNLFSDPDRQRLAEVWSQYFQTLFSGIETSQQLSFIRQPNLQDGDIVTRCAVTAARAMLVCFLLRDDSGNNQRAGMLLAQWTPDGVVAEDLMEIDVPDVGDCSTVRFDGVVEDRSVALHLHCTGKWNFAGLRILL